MNSESVDAGNRMEPAAMHQQPHTVTDGSAGTTEGAISNKEREEKLEQWMRNVKTFIRNIDVNSL